MSPTYRVFGACAVKSRSIRSGTGAADGSGIVVRTFLRRCSPAMPTRRMTRPTRLWLTATPVSRSSVVIGTRAPTRARVCVDPAELDAALHQGAPTKLG